MNTIKMLTPTQYRNFICDARYNAIKSNLPWDGRAIWQCMKNKQSDIENDDHGWSCCIRNVDRMELYDDAMTLDEFAPDGSTNEVNHFLMQCVRIPMLDKACPRKVYQIALNIGQLEASARLGEVKGKTLELYNRFVAMGMREIDQYI